MSSNVSFRVADNGWQTCEGKDLEVQIFNLKQM